MCVDVSDELVSPKPWCLSPARGSWKSSSLCQQNNKKHSTAQHKSAEMHMPIENRHPVSDSNKLSRDGYGVHIPIPNTQRASRLAGLKAVWFAAGSLVLLALPAPWMPGTLGAHNGLYAVRVYLLQLHVCPIEVEFVSIAVLHGRVARLPCLVLRGRICLRRGVVYAGVMQCRAVGLV
jgi:hypothetical protein